MRRRGSCSRRTPRLVRALLGRGLTARTDDGTGRPLPGQGKPIFFTDPDVLAIAERLGASPAQVVISWGVQRGIIVIPKSENVERMKANITVRRSLFPLGALGCDC